MFIGIRLGAVDLPGSSTPYLSASTALVNEKGEQAADILIFTRNGAVTPTAVTLSSVVPAGVLQMNADGVTLEYGATFLEFISSSVVTFTASFSDAFGGPYNTNFILEVLPVTYPQAGDLQFDFTVSVDVTNPVLSSPTGAAAGSSGFTGTFVTDEPNGFGKYVVIPNAAANPIITQIEAGTDGSDVAAPGGARSTTISTATTNVSGTGLTGSTDYKIAYAQRDNAGLPSNVVVSAMFTTAGAATVPAQMSAPTLASTATRITVTFAAAPPNGGSAITAYDVRHSINGGAGWTDHLNKTSGYVITGLVPGATAILVQTRAVNAIGNGAWSVSASIDMKTITLVGAVQAPTTSTTQATYSIDLTVMNTATGGIGGSVLEGDVIIGASGWATAGQDQNPDMSGWTEVADLYADDTNDCNLGVHWKAMGVTPDTFVTVNGSNNAANGSTGGVLVYRYVNPTAPFAVISTTATGIDTAVADAPAITPDVPGSKVLIAVAATGDTSPTTHDAPANMTRRNFRTHGGTTRGFRMMMADADGTNGVAFNPDTATPSESTTSDSWAAVTMCLEPY